MSETSSSSDGARWAAQRWPLIVLALLILGGYVDLRCRIADLSVGDAAATEATPSPAAPADGGALTPAPDAGADAASAEAPGAPEPPPFPAAWRCTGAIPQDAVRERLGRYGPRVFECYARAREDAPELRGTLMLLLRVDEGGQVVDSRISGTVVDASLHQCVSSALGSWTFPSPEGGECAIVEAPFFLAPPRPEPP